MNEENKFIRFDWAAKRMLRDKANFGVLEGLVTVLIGEPIHIVEILESEANQDTEEDKFNRVDIKAKNSRGEIILVEIQQTRELYYLQRILYGVAKTITEHIHLGEKYDQVKKVYSISILYFDLGRGADYLYHGQTTLIGVHTGDQLQINTKEEGIIKMVAPADVFPEYFIIRVNEFNSVAKSHLEEWLSYLKDGYIRKDTTAPGLQEAREKLQYMKMSDEERRAYDRHIDNIMVQNDVLDTARDEGWAEGHEKGRAEGHAEGREEGRAEGRAEGIEENKRESARLMKADGMPPELIAKYTGLSTEEVEQL
ncbi:MAG: Rpn family recombination-promoting nuclease/putative transposase [Prevotella sp.]|nr:Rpn family recombination-promoting nuclease/putative transposase [Prevotella sp.]